MTQIGEEQEIVWEIDPGSERYVRSSLVYTHRRRGPVRPPTGRRVGYANLRPDAANTGHPSSFLRRVFWLKDGDPYDGGGAPVEAVDPLTVDVGIEGEMTERAWGRPIPEHIDKHPTATPAATGAGATSNHHRAST